MTERLPCTTPGCKRTILPATAARTGGICKPCEQRLAQKEREEYIRRNRVTIDLFAGVSDPVEILELHHQPRPHNPLEEILPYPEPIQRVYQRLTVGQASELVGYAVDLLRRDESSKAVALLEKLSAFTAAPLDRALPRLVASNELRPGFLFRQAPPELRDRMIRRVARDAENRNDLLLALAWIGDPVVVDLFRGWREKPPRWAGKLYVPPEDYALEAGWELSESGERRDLFSLTCYALVPGEPPEDSPVHSVVKDDSQCLGCGRTLSILFDVDGSDERLRPILGSDEPLRVITCEVCTCYGQVLARPTAGAPELLLSEPAPPLSGPEADDDWFRLPEDRLVLAEARAPYQAAGWGNLELNSQIGGHPTWIQDAVYPRCPECQHRMPFVAQFAHEDFGEEGIFYAFACRTCRTTGTVYQQS